MKPFFLGRILKAILDDSHSWVPLLLPILEVIVEAILEAILEIILEVILKAQS